MKKANFQEALAGIIAKDPRYTEEAYLLVREALDFTMKDLAKPAEGPGRHVSGEELLGGLRKFALRDFGPMARTVLARWGVKECMDVGNIVFNLVNHGVLGKSERDKPEDFAGSFTLGEALSRPFLPAEPPAPAKAADKAERKPRSARQQA